MQTKQIKLVIQHVESITYSIAECTAWAYCTPETPCLGCFEWPALGNLQRDNVSQMHVKVLYDLHSVLPLLV